MRSNTIRYQMRFYFKILLRVSDGKASEIIQIKDKKRTSVILPEKWKAVAVFIDSKARTCYFVNIIQGSTGPEYGYYKTDPLYFILYGFKHPSQSCKTKKLKVIQIPLSVSDRFEIR